MAFINDYTETYNPVARDEERGIVLRRIPAGPDPIYPFILEWHGKEVKFAGEKTKDSFQDESGAWVFNYDWEILSITAPEGFPENEETICAAISEALDCFGEEFSRNRIGKIDVKFSLKAFEGEGFY